jgi:hypothetical protein
MGVCPSVQMSVPLFSPWVAVLFRPGLSWNQESINELTFFWVAIPFRAGPDRPA